MLGLTSAGTHRMQRYYFHFRWPDDAVTDTEGVELEGFAAAYDYACGLVHKVRNRFPEADEGWWIEISDGISKPTAVLPATVPGASANIPKLRALLSTPR